MDIKIEKRHVYIIVSLILLSTGILFVRGQSSNFGHSGDDVIVTIGGVDKTLNEALNEGGIANADCVTVRITEAAALGETKMQILEDTSDDNYVVDSDDGPGTPISNVVNTPGFKTSGGGIGVPAGIGGDYFGASCYGNWKMTACSHAADSGDSDYILITNGCYADEADGSKNNNFVDMKCCSI